MCSSDLLIGAVATIIIGVLTFIRNMRADAATASNTQAELIRSWQMDATAQWRELTRELREEVNVLRLRLEEHEAENELMEKEMMAATARIVELEHTEQAHAIRLLQLEEENGRLITALADAQSTIEFLRSENEQLRDMINGISTPPLE